MKRRVKAAVRRQSNGLDPWLGMAIEIRWWRFRQAVNLCVRAKRLLDEAGLQAHEVRPGVLVPLLEGATLADEVRPVRGFTSEPLTAPAAAGIALCGPLASEGRIRAGGIDKEVTVEDANDAVNDQVDAAYRSKYGRYASIVDGITDAEARSTTLKLVPRSTDSLATPRPRATM